MLDCPDHAKARGLCNKHYLSWKAGRLGTIKPTKLNKLDRFFAQVEKTESCWIWLGARLPNTYGRFAQMLAHRFSYAQFVGPIPAGMHVDHLCFNKLCVNPEHLEVVTPLENTRRWFALGIKRVFSPRGGRVPTRPPKNTHCKRGHELTPINIEVRANGFFVCAECARIRNRERSKRLRQINA